MKKTLTFKLVITMTCIVAGTILFGWFLNKTFLERIYVADRQNNLVDSYELLAEAYEDGTLGDNSFLLEFQRAYTTNNLDVIVTQDSTVILSTARDRSKIIEQYEEIVAAIRKGQYSNEIKDNGRYVITRQQDSSLKEEYLILYGTAGNKGEIFMRTPIATMEEIASITSMFFGITGILALFISVIVILVMSRSISRPIQELTGISRKMAELQFESKYVSRRSNSKEIDALGENINVLSGNLEKTISELKSANNELLRDIQQKEEIDEMRKEFLSNVSHELKTPLAIIEGYAEGLKECVNDDAEGRDYYCDVIIDESEKMNRMVQKLLALNNLEFGNNAVEMQRFDLRELVSGVLEAFKVLLEKNNITVKHSGDEPIYVWADPFMIEDVITNYISNAINHSKGERIIDITYQNMEGVTRLYVYNTGDLIPEEELDKVWVKFYKVDKARTREYGGSGIGLSIVKAIVDLHNQKCGVENAPDGVKFWVDLDTNC